MAQVTPRGHHKAWRLGTGGEETKPVTLTSKDESKAVPVGFLEFDDQGELWRYDREDGETGARRSQLPYVLAALRREIEKGPVRLVIFVHGWKHNAAPDDSNYKKFALSLEEIKRSKKQRVFGVYVSWKGKTNASHLQIDYWNREATALRVGRVEASGAIHALCAAAHSHPDGRVVGIGHSFGGIILLHTLAAPLAAEMGAAVGRGGGVVRPAMDTIVLVNPADNGILSRHLVRTMDNFAAKYTREGVDVPLITSLTSNADRATGHVYFGASAVGRNLFYYLPSVHGGATHSWNQEKAAISSIGFHSAFRNRKLEKRKRRSENGEIVVDLREEQGGPHVIAKAVKPPTEMTNNTPYWILQVPKYVIKGHGDIWNEGFAALVDALFYAPRVNPLDRMGIPPRAVLSVPALKDRKRSIPR
jgi:hypothetical protein